MQKQLSLIVDNTNGYDADLVLFDALKNPAHIINPLNTYQTSNNINNICHPVYSIEAQIRLSFAAVKTGLCNFQEDGTLSFDIEQAITQNYMGNCKISLAKGSYFQFLEFLKTSSIFIQKAQVSTSLGIAQDENWRIINTKENGETNEELLTGTKVIAPNTVNASVGFFNVNKYVNRFTSIVIKVRAGEKKTYTVFYS